MIEIVSAKLPEGLPAAPSENPGLDLRTQLDQQSQTSSALYLLPCTVRDLRGAAVLEEKPRNHSVFSFFGLPLREKCYGRLRTWISMCFRVQLALLVVSPGALASTRTCIGPDAAGKHVNKDVCITAHVYDVVELKDGTRFLDVCSPETTDANCRFTIVSLSEDREGVGDLVRLKEQDIQVRGLIRPVNDDRTELILSREQQFHGGAGKFRANPTLLKGFSAEGHASAFSDPAMKSSRHRGALTRPPRHD